jgi:hypothetical protein
MDGASADPDPGRVTPPTAFFGFWPRFADAADDRMPAEPRLVAIPRAGTSPVRGSNEWERIAGPT